MNITSESNSNFTFNRSDILSDNIDTKLKVSNEQNGGGLFCKDEYTKILLECFSDDRPDIACYLLCKLDKKPNDLTMCSKDKKNILHYMTIYASHNNIVIHLSKLLKETDKNEIMESINSQDHNGNTPLHYATLLGYNNLVKLYIENGGDCNIKNKKGEYVGEDNNDINTEKNNNDIVINIANVSEERDNHTFSFKRNMIEDNTDEELDQQKLNNLSKLYIGNSADCNIKNNNSEYLEEDNNKNDNHIIAINVANIGEERDNNTFSFKRNMIEDNTDSELHHDKLNNNILDEITSINNLLENGKSEDETTSIRTEHFLHEIQNMLDREQKMKLVEMPRNINTPQILNTTLLNTTQIPRSINTTEIYDDILVHYNNKNMVGGTLSNNDKELSNNDNKLYNNDNELSINTNDIINNIIARKDTTLKGGGNNNDEISVNTTDIINNIISKTYNQDRNSDHENNLNMIGGELSDNSKKSKKKHKKDKYKKNNKLSRIQGKRLISTFSEISVSLQSTQSRQMKESTESLSRAVESDGSDISDIARQISRQSSDIHERSVIKIIEILKLDRNNSDDMQKARNYKAAIYKMVKEKNPLLNNFDRAVEMEKLITKETLAKIDINKVSKEIEKHMSEKTASTIKSETTDTPNKTELDTTKKTKANKTKTKKQARQHLTETSLSLTFNTSSVSSSEFSSESN